MSLLRTGGGGDFDALATVAVATDGDEGTAGGFDGTRDGGGADTRFDNSLAEEGGEGGRRDSPDGDEGGGKGGRDKASDEDNGAGGGRDAPAGEEGSGAGGRDAPAGEEGSGAGGRDAPAGEDEGAAGGAFDGVRVGIGCVTVPCGSAGSFDVVGFGAFGSFAMAIPRIEQPMQARAFSRLRFEIVGRSTDARRAT